MRTACSHRISPSTDSAVVLACLYQAEAAVVIIAQTVPLIRVLFQGSKATSVTAAIPQTAESEKGPAAGQSVLGTDDIELVELPTGRIVAAESEEGRAFQAAQAAAGTNTATAAGHEDETRERDVAREGSTIIVDDELHKMWADMGLSRRAWSTSPELSR